MKKIRANGDALPLNSLLDTYTYLRSDPMVADKTAATFVRYLIEQYRIDRFLELYRKADDLNLRESLESVYGKSVDDLAQEWNNFMDTISVKANQLRYYADQAEVMFDFGLMLEYTHEEMALAKNRSDTVAVLPALVRSMFFTGDYYGAAASQERLLKIDSGSAAGWMKLASYLMMNGYYERAGEVLERAKSLDSSDQVVDFNRALNRKLSGDEQSARDILASIVDFPNEYSPQVEGRIFLADLLMNTGNQSDRVRAENYFREATAMLGKTVQTGHPSSQHQLWNGIAHLGLGDTGAAWDYLQTAIYLETRPFYEGMACLWMGKLADVRGERDVARHYYGRVLSLSSADYHQREARKYLETPYSP
jgi:tetratricopeptide (TPR) repeat protein